ncbi:hypothetical protein EW146_g7442 [Bondarzewia mesenterica]|uniref:GST C-terminal domain-containing protein n=1 Tax=Bondarzewia mesenterica TaxID=1095465 RepID=A0A4S4LKX4_9AGAM|nr:hypothetical protein EW146_g7442 [Bondarzewia mesenterica]
MASSTLYQQYRFQGGSSSWTVASSGLERASSVFRNFVTKGGLFPPEKNRYHLYVSYACQFSSRTLIMRKLKGLEEIIPATIVTPHLGVNGWPFASVDYFPGAEIDPLYNSRYVKDLYLRADPDYIGSFTVPVLWDKIQHKIVNNESADIVRLFNSAFNDLLPQEDAVKDFYPPELQEEIDAMNAMMYEDITYGVYNAGFATTLDAYSAAVVPLFEALDRMERLLAGRTYLVGNRLTEADVRLYVTIIRFDPVYVGHFKCNLRTIRHGYPNIHLWLRRLYWKNDAFQSTTDFQHIKTSYYWSHKEINPYRIVPIGPVPHIESL